MKQLVGLAVATFALNAATSKPAVPSEPVGAILDAFRSHRIVALGEGRHTNEQGHAFRLALIRDPRFAATVNDIVVESGTAQCQDVMDRYVRGDDVPREELRHVWQDTIQTSAVWDHTIYEEFYRAVRDLNVSLPRERQLRVLLGSQPIDWSRVHTPADYEREIPSFGDQFPTSVIQQEVLRKGRRALVVYGEGHLHRASGAAVVPTSIVDRLEAAGTRVYLILPATMSDPVRIDGSAAGWPRPALVPVRHTALGAVDRGYWGGGPADPPRVRPSEQDFDALLYLGPPASITLSPLSDSLCGDPAYLATRLTRMRLRGAEQEALKVQRQCAAQQDQTSAAISIPRVSR